jgi:hypothetical protein
MARGKRVDLATGRSFNTMGEATEFFKAILNSYVPGDSVSDEDGYELTGLLERHREYDKKISCGIDHFEVMSAEYGTQCFLIVRTDGSKTDFSYRHCIKRDSPTRKTEVANGFR